MKRKKKRKNSIHCVTDLPIEIFHFEIFKYIGNIKTIINSISFTCKCFNFIVNDLIKQRHLYLHKKEQDILKLHFKTIKINERLFKDYKKNRVLPKTNIRRYSLDEIKKRGINIHFKNFNEIFGGVNKYEKDIQKRHVNFILNEINSIINKSSLIATKPQKSPPKKSYNGEVYGISNKIEKDNVTLKIIMAFKNFYCCYTYFQCLRHDCCLNRCNNFSCLFPKQQVHFYKGFKELCVHPEIFQSYFFI